MLLGKLRYKENGATYDSRSNTYTIKRENEYVLRPMDKKLFKSWRKDRLRKIKEPEEARKKEAEVVVISSAPVQSTNDTVLLGTDSKPRTVSREEREDDTTIPISSTIISYHVKVESKYLQLTSGAEDESVHRTCIHSVAVQDMNAYAFWPWTKAMKDSDFLNCFVGQVNTRQSVTL
jgi:hypothetical protein